MVLLVRSLKQIRELIIEKENRNKAENLVESVVQSSLWVTIQITTKIKSRVV